MAQWVREKVKELVDSHQIPPLPDKTVTTLDKLRRQGEEELTGK